MAGDHVMTAFGLVDPAVVSHVELGGLLPHHPVARPPARLAPLLLPHTPTRAGFVAHSGWAEALARTKLTTSRRSSRGTGKWNPQNCTGSPGAGLSGSHDSR